MKQECVVRSVSGRLTWRQVIGAVLFGCVCAMWASPVMAQEEAGADAASDTEEGAAAEVDAIPEDLDPSDPRYWSSVRGIQTVQRRPYLKEGRFAATAYVGIIPNNIFSQYFPVGLRLNYFVLENLGLELSGSYACGLTNIGGDSSCGRDTGLTQTLTDRQGINSDGVLLGDEQIAHFNFGVLWSPVFGKAAFHNKTLDYFDMYLFGGIGGVVKQTTPGFNQDPEVDFGVEGAIGAGLMYYLTNNYVLRLDFRQFIFQKVTGGVANPSEISLGFTYML